MTQFDWKRDSGRIAWGQTLVYNHVRAAASGVIWFLLMALGGELQWAMLAMPLFYLAGCLPIGLALKWLAMRDVPFTAWLYILFALPVCMGDPLLWALFLAWPQLNRWIEKQPFFSFQVILPLVNVPRPEDSGRTHVESAPAKDSPAATASAGVFAGALPARATASAGTEKGGASAAELMDPVLRGVCSDLATRGLSPRIQAEGKAVQFALPDRAAAMFLGTFVRKVYASDTESIEVLELMSTFGLPAGPARFGEERWPILLEYIGRSYPDPRNASETLELQESLGIVSLTTMVAVDPGSYVEGTACSMIDEAVGRLRFHAAPLFLVLGGPLDRLKVEDLLRCAGQAIPALDSTPVVAARPGPGPAPGAPPAVTTMVAAPASPTAPRVHPALLAAFLLVVIAGVSVVIWRQLWPGTGGSSGPAPAEARAAVEAQAPVDLARDGSKHAAARETQAEATFVRAGEGSGNSAGSVLLRIGDGQAQEYLWDSGTTFQGRPPSWTPGELWSIRYTEEEREGQVVRWLARVETPNSVAETYGLGVDRLLAGGGGYWTCGETPWPSDAEAVWAIVYSAASEPGLVRTRANVSTVGTDADRGSEMSVRVDGFRWCGQDVGNGPAAPPCVVALFSGTGFHEGDVSPVQVSPVGATSAVSHRAGIPAEVFAAAEPGQVPPAGYSLLFPDFRKPDDPGEEYTLRFDRQGDVWLETEGGRQKVLSGYSDSGQGASLTVHLAGDLDRDGKLDLVLAGPGGPRMLLSRLRKNGESVGDTRAKAMWCGD